MERCRPHSKTFERIIPDDRALPGKFDWRVPLLCAVCALAIACVALIPSLMLVGWRVSILVRMAASDPIAQMASASDPNFAFVPPAGHFDGTYYYAMARDPFGFGVAHKLIDQSVYRYIHPGYGWLAGIISLGRAAAIPSGLLVVNLAGLALGAFLVSLIAREIGRSPWWGMLVALNPGFIYGATNDTPEPLLIAVTGLGLLLWLRRQHVMAGIVLVGASFVYPAVVLVPLGLGVYEVVGLLHVDRLLHRNFERRAGAIIASCRPRLRRIAILAATPVAYALWWVYLREHFGAWPNSDPPTFWLPGRGIADTLHSAASVGLEEEFNAMQIGMAMVPIIAVLGGMLVLVVLWSARLRKPLQGVALVTAILLLSLGWGHFLYPKDLIRTVATPVTLMALAVLERPSRLPAADGPQWEAPLSVGEHKPN